MIIFQKKNDKYIVYLRVDEFTNYDIKTSKNEIGYAGNDYEIYLEKKGEKFVVDSANINVDCDPTDAEFNINKELGYKPRWEPEYSHDSVSRSNEKSASNSKNEVIKPLNDFSNEDNLGIRVSKIMQHFEKLSHCIDDRDNPKNIVVVPGYKSSNNISNSQRETIRAYAERYAYDYNHNYLKFDSDCANFASQALRKAGARADHSHSIYIDGKDRTWSLVPDSFHLQETYGDAWAQAHYLVAFIQRNEGGYRGPGGHTISQGSNLS